MAAGLKAALGLMSKGKMPAAEGDEPAKGGALDEKAAAIKAFFAKGEAGDFTGAAHEFQRAYDICAEAKADAEEY